MSRFDDDLSPFRDDPVFQALTGPATPDELAGEASAVAAYRAANAGRPRRRIAMRVGTSGAVAAVAVALSAGAAAAYTAVLPTPVQDTLHDAFGTLGVPAPLHHRHAQGAAAETTTSPEPPGPAAVVASSPAPTGRPSPQPSSGTPSALPTASASPTATTLPVVAITPTSSPTPSMSPSGQPPLPGASLVITTDESEVSFGTAVAIAGKLTDQQGVPVVGREVALVEHLVGEPGWNKVGDEAATGADGQVSFAVPPLDHNARFALHAGGHVHSSVVTVSVDPTITTAVATPAADASETTVTVTVVGAEEGDVVLLDRLGRHPMTRTADLSTTGQATFTVPVPIEHRVRYRIAVRPTDAHKARFAVVTVSPPGVSTS
jgi:hypothetical protein